jgi:two-component system sensor histidine kinase KdpD
MDLAPYCARRPEVALVDELAHTKRAGQRPNTKRWQDIDDLLDAGIDVISTVNIQHLESINDVVQKITGCRSARPVPDVIVRRADQIELIDMPPEALRRRMAHGNIYAADKVDARAQQLLPAGESGRAARAGPALVADRVEPALQDYRQQARHRRHLGGRGSGWSSASPVARRATR